MIVDFHTHAFPPAIASRTLASLEANAGFKPHGDGTAASVIRAEKLAGADLAVILNIVTRPGQETTINNTAASQDALISGTGGAVCFGSVHPKSPHAAHEVSRIAALGLKGIKLHPDYQETMIDDEAYAPVFERAQELGLIVVVHAGWDPLSPDLVHAPPERSARVLKQFPRLKLVLAHLGGLMRYDETERYLAGKFENLYLDTSFSTGAVEPEQAKRIIAAQGADRVLFGSDFPWRTPGEELAYLRGLDLGEEAEEKILGANACRLLGITV